MSEAAARVVMWYPTAIINCPCQEGSVSLIVTTGFMNPSACGKCGKLYQSRGFAPNPLNPSGLPDIVVDIIQPTEKKLVM